MSNSAGLPYMWIMVGTSITDGGAGPTLYKLTKATGAVTRLGPIFTGSNAYHSGETMYFSYSMPNAIYYVSDGKTTLNYINVPTHEKTEVFDVDAFQTNHHIFACSSSYDGETHACTYEDANWNYLGCIVYHSDTDTFQYFDGMTPSGINECHVGPGGEYVLIDEKTPTTCPECSLGTVIAILDTGRQIIIPNKEGAGGHYSVGYGYYTQNQNWDAAYDQVMLWKISDLSSAVGDVWSQPWGTQCVNTSGDIRCAAVPAHPSWLNAVPPCVQPVAQQYVCDSSANSINVPFANQVFCYDLDPTVAPEDQQSLVIAPTMINVDKTGYGDGYYANLPKGNIDYTGHYFMWSANLDSNDNCQVFLVKIPTSRLPYRPPFMSPPYLSVTHRIDRARGRLKGQGREVSNRRRPCQANQS